MAETHAPIKVVRLPDVCVMVGLKRAAIYRLAQKGSFPKPIKISTKLSGWIESEVCDWINSRIALRDGGAK